MIYALLPPSLVEAIGYTLLHSLWLGAAFALALYAALVASSGRSAMFRYCLSVSALLGFAAGVTAVFAYEYGVASAALTHATAAATDLAAAAASEDGGGLGVSGLTLRRLLSQALPPLVTAWLLGALAFQLRLLARLAYVRRLRTRGAGALPTAWRDTVARLEGALSLRRPVRYLLSERVATPMTVGFLRPVVLLPSALLSRLTDTEVYAVLAHELAHVKRDDYLVNVAQAILRAVFFYHPGVYFVSECVDVEREHACDDLAVALTGDPTRYAEALLAVSTLPAHGVRPALALAAIGEGDRATGLSARVKRLFGVRTASVRPNTPWTSAGSVLLAGALALAVNTSATGETEGGTRNGAVVTAGATGPIAFSLTEGATADTLPPAEVERLRGEYLRQHETLGERLAGVADRRRALDEGTGKTAAQRQRETEAYNEYVGGLAREAQRLGELDERLRANLPAAEYAQLPRLHAPPPPPPPPAPAAPKPPPPPAPDAPKPPPPPPPRAPKGPQLGERSGRPDAAVFADLAGVASRLYALADELDSSLVDTETVLLDGGRFAEMRQRVEAANARLQEAYLGRSVTPVDTAALRRMREEARRASIVAEDAKAEAREMRAQVKRLSAEAEAMRREAARASVAARRAAIDAQRASKRLGDPTDGED